MSTLDSVKSALQAEISRANATTGESDTTISDAIGSLISGFGKGGITPTGTKSITANGTYDVTAYASANVNVPSSGITPSGSKTVTENGTYDVTSFASVVVSVTEKMVCYVLTLDAMTGKSAYYPTLLSNNTFVKEHYAKDGFYVILRPLTSIATGANIIGGLYHGNRLLLNTGTAWYGFGFTGGSAGTSLGGLGITGKVNGTTYNAGFRVNSSGNVQLVLPASRNIAAGQYELVIGYN